MKSILEFLQSQLPWLVTSWSRLTRFLLLYQSSQHRVYTSEEKQKEQFNIQGLTKELQMHGRKNLSLGGWKNTGSDTPWYRYPVCSLLLLDHYHFWETSHLPLP